MAEPRRDRYGRYLITPPSGGEAVAHTRTTTIAGTLDDTSNLDKWKQRHVALGLAARLDLFALAQATPAEDKTTLNRVCKDAIEASAASSRANIGSAVHGFTEQIDRGKDIAVPGPWDGDVRAYRECCEQYGIEIQPEWVECIAVCEALDEPVAGTIDRIVQWGYRNVIADLKTGQDLRWSWGKIAVQLAIYSRAKSLYDPQAEQHKPMPEVDQNHGIVFHIPAGEGVCTPYLIDLNAGWEAAVRSVDVRAWRRRKDLAEEMGVAA